MANVDLTNDQKTYRQKIIEYGFANGFSPNEISYALKAGFIESGFNPDIPGDGIHTGIFQQNRGQIEISLG